MQEYAEVIGRAFSQRLQGNSGQDLNPPEDVFRSVAENTVPLSGIESDSGDILDVLFSQEDLAKVSIQIF